MEVLSNAVKVLLFCILVMQHCLTFNKYFILRVSKSIIIKMYSIITRSHQTRGFYLIHTIDYILIYHVFHSSTSNKPNFVLFYYCCLYAHHVRSRHIMSRPYTMFFLTFYPNYFEWRISLLLCLSSALWKISLYIILHCKYVLRNLSSTIFSCLLASNSYCEIVSV